MLYLLILRESEFDNNVQSDLSVRVVLEDANLKPGTNPASKTCIMFKYIGCKKKKKYMSSDVIHHHQEPTEQCEL
jgi:hypothetical protein